MYWGIVISRKYLSLFFRGKNYEIRKTIPKELKSGDFLVVFVPESKKFVGIFKIGEILYGNIFSIIKTRKLKFFRKEILNYLSGRNEAFVLIGEFQPFPRGVSYEELKSVFNEFKIHPGIFKLEKNIAEFIINLGYG